MEQDSHRKHSVKSVKPGGGGLNLDQTEKQFLILFRTRQNPHTQQANKALWLLET